MRLTTMLLAAAAAGWTSCGACAPADVVGNPVAAEFAARLHDYQRPDGALMLYPLSTGNGRLVPYFSNLAALGWTETARVTSDTAARKRMLDATRRWLDWYAGHMNADGTVDDYECAAGGACKATGDYDSSDSYPATFLLLLWRHHTASGEKEIPAALIPAIRNAHRAMELTMDDDGLTYAKPFFPVKYLMDNCEVAVGLGALSRIYGALGDGAAKARTDAQLAKLLAQMGRFHRDDAKGGYLGFQIIPFGLVEGKLEKAYPDVLAQLLALGWLSNGDEGAARLLGRVRTDFWDVAGAEHGFPVAWTMAALTCGDRALAARTFEKARADCAKKDAFAHDLGLAAMLAATGVDAITFPDTRITWKSFTTRPAPAAAKPDRATTAAVPAGSRAVITAHKGRGATGPAAAWKADNITLPLSAAYELLDPTGYVQLNIVFPAETSWAGARSLAVDFSVAGGGLGGGHLSVMEADGDLWDAPLPASQGPATVDLGKLRINPWGKGGDGSPDLSRIVGLRIQVAAPAPAKGAIVVKSLDLNRG